MVFSSRLFALSLLCSSAAAFSGTSSFGGAALAPPNIISRTAPPRRGGLDMFFGPKDDGSPGDYICKDCGYVFTKGPAAWEKLGNGYGVPAVRLRQEPVQEGPEGGAREEGEEGTEGGRGGARQAREEGVVLSTGEGGTVERSRGTGGRG
eukprot:CAMPEP_0194266330 /NCGR_PEP_ID=MMETSP0169-20130528/1271_1 /TAXON_ID=218684 /ORGANISM="Corethron pennatum, Strain L29A3" /LENGTH=149 /DNA_ID=CAMNT_0039006987 /DNA_START=163 /DNA_END=611 /DNA_ORIENTATION=+